MAPRALVLAAGAAAAGALGALWGGAVPVACLGAAVLGAALVLHPSAPRAGVGVVLAGLALTLAGGELGVAAALLLGLNAFGIGRYADGRLRLAAAVLLPAGAMSRVHGDDFAFDLFVTVAPFLGGWALADRDRVARQLAARGAELEAERDAFAELSVRYERARIAGELHDIVAHAISVMVVQAGAGQRLARADPAGTQEAFAAIGTAARQAEADMGRLVTLLTDAERAPSGADLVPVRELVSRAAGAGLDVTLTLDGELGALTSGTSRAAYLVVREGLTNALRHAAGAAVRVGIHGGEDALEVDVANGPATGFTGPGDPGGGTGLRGLRERLDAEGGRLDAGPTADGGFLLRVRLPRPDVLAAR